MPINWHMCCASSGSDYQKNELPQHTWMNEWNTVNWSEICSHRNTKTKHINQTKWKKTVSVQIEQSMPFIDFEKSFCAACECRTSNWETRRKKTEKKLIIIIDDDKEWMLKIRWRNNVQSKMLRPFSCLSICSSSSSQCASFYMDFIFQHGTKLRYLVY